MPRPGRRVRAANPRRPPAPTVTLQAIPEMVDRWRIEPFGVMRVPGVVFTSDALLAEVAEEEALRQ